MSSSKKKSNGVPDATAELVGKLSIGEIIIKGVSDFTVIVLDQVDYDAMETHDASTLYMIRG